MKVFITGNSSFFSKLLSKSSKNIEILDIKSTTNRKSEEMLFDLGFLNQVKNDSFIVHSAWNMETREENASRKININGSINFFNSLDEKLKERFIFVSSVGAHRDAVSTYGKHKYEVEEHIIKNNGLILKCGLLINEQDPFSEGFFSDLYKLAKKVPIIPNFSGINRIYQITNTNNIKKSFENFEYEKNNKVRINYCFNEKKYSFKELVKNVMKLNKPIINVPWFIGYYTARLFEILQINFQIKSDSLLGIKEIK